MRTKVDMFQALASENPIELARGKSYRGSVETGDIFALHIVNHGWILGRVIFKNPSMFPGEQEGGFEDTFLIYLYSGIYPNKPTSVSLPILPELILPPLVVDDELWSLGVASQVTKSEIGKDEILKKHCFFHFPTEKFHDEYGVVCKKPVKPCGPSSLMLVSGLEKYLARSLRDGFDQNNHPLN